MITGWHHTNLIVSDFERSLEFYTGKLGFQVALRTDLADDEFNRGVGLPGAQLKVAFIQVPNTDVVIEMFQYLNKEGKPIPKDQLACDNGFKHICFTVDDIDKTYEELKAKGLEFLSTPVTIAKDHPDVAGVRFCYFKGPDDEILEILQLPA